MRQVAAYRFVSPGTPGSPFCPFDGEIGPGGPGLPGSPLSPFSPGKPVLPGRPGTPSSPAGAQSTKIFHSMRDFMKLIQKLDMKQKMISDLLVLESLVCQGCQGHLEVLEYPSHQCHP